MTVRRPSNFVYKVQRKLEKENYLVAPVSDSTCPFDLISISPKGKAAGIKCKLHGHVYAAERERLIAWRIPVFIASESEEHEIFVKPLI